MNGSRDYLGRISCLVTCAVLWSASTAQSQNGGPAQQDPRVAAEQRNCDVVAEQSRAQVGNLTPINPVSALNPILLLNDINRRKQEEARQPQLLEQIEQQRQFCYRDAETRAALRAQETIDQKRDNASGYKLISFETFALDAKIMASSQAKVSLRGSYVPDGNMDWFFANRTDVIMATTNGYNSSNIARIPLLTEDATREFRQFLLRCKSNASSSQLGCPAVINGHVTKCSLTGPLGANRSLPCIVVENGRELR
jgi:hypothetical protein